LSGHPSQQPDTKKILSLVSPEQASSFGRLTTTMACIWLGFHNGAGEGDFKPTEEESSGPKCMDLFYSRRST
jgi:hypothetical protein